MESKEVFFFVAQNETRPKCGETLNVGNSWITWGLLFFSLFIGDNVTSAISYSKQGNSINLDGIHPSSHYESRTWGQFHSDEFPFQPCPKRSYFLHNGGEFRVMEWMAEKIVCI